MISIHPQQSLLSLSVLCTSLSSAEYGYLLLGHDPIVLNQGDKFEILDVPAPYNDSDKGNYNFRVDINLDGSYDFEANLLKTQFIIGPCSFELVRSNNPPAVYIAYKLTRASEEVLTSNTVTLPAVNGLDWAVTLEQSTDLANWTAVAPGSVTGTDSLQFYRVRVTSNASSGE